MNESIAEQAEKQSTHSEAKKMLKIKSSQIQSVRSKKVKSTAKKSSEKE